MANRTIKDWLNELPEPYRTQALRNTIKQVLEVPVEDIQDALMSAFRWENSPQRHDYWEKLYNTL